MTDKKAIVLLSGGIDSYTTAAIAVRENFSVYALSFRYHQRHSVEIESAKKIVSALNIKKHLIITMDIFKIAGKSALTASIAVPKNRTENEISKNIPVTYVPARNTLFLSYALCWAESIEAYDIFIGVNAVDYSGYPDCRPEYIEAYRKMANLATKTALQGNPVSIRTPLINLAKSQIIKKGISINCDYSLSISCYNPDKNGFSCGKCDSCIIRKKGFAEAGVPDPTQYY